MKTIWKYKLEITEQQTIEMPATATFLTMQVQHDVVTVWYLVNPKEDHRPRRFAIYGTGHEMPDEPGTYLGTFQIVGGALIFHVFEARS